MPFNVSSNNNFDNYFNQEKMYPVDFNGNSQMVPVMKKQVNSQESFDYDRLEVRKAFGNHNVEMGNGNTAQNIQLPTFETRNEPMKYMRPPVLNQRFAEHWTYPGCHPENQLIQFYPQMVQNEQYEQLMEFRCYPTEEIKEVPQVGKQKKTVKRQRKAVPYDSEKNKYYRKCRDTDLIKKWTFGPKMEVFDIHEKQQMKPYITILNICKLACKNSPTGWVKNVDIYSFCLHHWAYFRTASDTWKNSIRHALLEKTNRGVFERMNMEGDAKGEISYSLKNPDSIKYSRQELDYIHSLDPRGMEFYDRLLKGQVGLPRQLFYHVIGIRATRFAGPENSALFYHLLSIGVIPEAHSTLFKCSISDDVSGNEPMFEEQKKNYVINSLSDPNNLTSYRVNLNNGEIERKWTIEMSNWFYRNINQYFQIQKEWKQNGKKNWETPSIYGQSHDNQNDVQRV